MKYLALAACLPLLAAPVFADNKTEGREIAELSFESTDDQGRGFVDMAQMESMRADIYYSMDTNEDGILAKDEFLEWGFGFENIAEEEGKLVEYKTALKVVYGFWDRNGDGSITEGEHRKAIVADIERADLNGDAVLDKSEFLRGFSVLVAIRAALQP